MNGNELKCSSCGKILADMGNVGTGHGFSKAWEGALCTRCRLLWCDDCRPPAPPRPPACPKCGQSLKPTAECYLWDGAYTQEQNIDAAVRKEADERKAQRLDKARYDKLLQAVREKPAEDIIAELKPSASELVAFAHTLDLNVYANSNISVDKLMRLLENTKDAKAADAIPLIALRYGPNRGPGGQGVEVYEPSGIRMAEALTNLGRPESVVQRLLEFSADERIDWCNQLLIIACLAQLHEPTVGKVIQKWLRPSRPDEPLLSWVSELLERAIQKLKRPENGDSNAGKPETRPEITTGSNATPVSPPSTATPPERFIRALRQQKEDVTTEATPRNTRTIQSKGTSIADVRHDARSRVPKGWYVYSERVISDGKTGTTTGKGQTEKAATQSARESLPRNAVDPESTTRQEAATQTITVAAVTEDAARSEAIAVVGGRDSTVCECILAEDGRKGILGIGKRPPKFTVKVRKPAIVDMKYGTPAIIELILSDVLPPAEHYRKRYDNAEFDEVIEELSSVLDSLAADSEHRKVLSSACSDRGGAMFKRHNLTQALQDFELAVRANPENWRALVNLSTVYLHNKRLDEAQHSLEKAIEINPSLSSNAQVTSQLSRLRSRHS